MLRELEVWEMEEVVGGNWFESAVISACTGFGGAVGSRGGYGGAGVGAGVAAGACAAAIEFNLVGRVSNWVSERLESSVEMHSAWGENLGLWRRPIGGGD
jgi:hypothetical protein